MNPDRYTVIRTNNCIVVDGAIPTHDMGALLVAWTGGVDLGEWMLDSRLADYLGVTVVAGPRSACRAWQERLGISLEGQPRRFCDPDGANLVPRLENGATARYRLVTGPYQGIECLQCGRTSYNPNDVRHRFCAHCDDFLESDE
jgi:RNase P subunit RPR2